MSALEARFNTSLISTSSGPCTVTFSIAQRIWSRQDKYVANTIASGAAGMEPILTCNLLVTRPGLLWLF